MNIYNLNDFFEFHFNLARFDTGVATDADATPTWRCYEENNDTVVTNDNCAKRDDANTTGYYYARGQITGAAGFELGKNYVVRAAATVNSVAAAAVIGTFKVISVTRGLAGTALPDAAADGAGGLPISDAGGLDVDTLNANVSSILTDTGTDGVLLTAAYNAAKTAAQAGDAMTLANDAITAAKFDESTAFPIKAADTGATIIARAGDAMTLTGAYDAAKTAAQAGSAMTLADDAITAAKFDESTAFPLKAADSGATQVARVGADSDTLKTLSDQIDATALEATAQSILTDTGTTLPGTLANLALEATAQSILTDTGTTLPGTLTTIEGKVDTVDGIVDSILLDTGELQTDWTNGGRLDLLIDAIKTKTDLLPVSPAKNEALPQFVFLMVDNTDHITPLEGLTVTGQISKDGAAFAGISNPIAEISNGFYKITGGITQAEMNADVVALRFSAVGADQRSIVIVTSS